MTPFPKRVPSFARCTALAPTALALTALALPAPALAAAPLAAHADPAAIDRAVARFVAADPAAAGAVAMAVDPRLRLAPCDVALRLSWYGARRDSVRVECPPLPDQGSPGWRVFVRVSGAEAQEASAAPLVLRGEAVSIAVAGQGFTIARSGEALEPGALGQWIRVRTAPTAAPLRARVSGPGTVELVLR